MQLDLVKKISIRYDDSLPDEDELVCKNDSVHKRNVSKITSI